MKGLLLKDFYTAVKYLCMSFIIIIIFFLISFMAYGSGFSFFIVYPMALAGLSVVTLLSYDEKNRWNIYSNTLPFSRKQIVSEKYLCVLIFVAIIWSLLAVVQAVIMITNDGFAIEEYLGFMAVYMLFGLIGPSMMLPVIFKYGVEKGRIIYYLVVGALCGGSAMIANVEDNILDISIPAIGIGIGILIIAVIIFAASWLVSIKIYEKRDL